MNGLTLKRHCLENRVKAEVKKIKTYYDAERDCCKGCLFEDQASVYKQHLKFAQTHGMLSGRDYQGIFRQPGNCIWKVCPVYFHRMSKDFLSW